VVRQVQVSCLIRLSKKTLLFKFRKQPSVFFFYIDSN